MCVIDVYNLNSFYHIFKKFLLCFLFLVLVCGVRVGVGVKRKRRGRNLGWVLEKGQGLPPNLPTPIVHQDYALSHPFIVLPHSPSNLYSLYELVLYIIFYLKFERYMRKNKVGRMKKSTTTIEEENSCFLEKSAQNKQ